MSDSTRTAYTAHGKVDYETVVCDSCEMEVPKETATEWVMGDIWVHHDSDNHTYEEFRYKTTPLRGWACADCRENSVTFVPARTRHGQPRLWMLILLAFVVGIAVGVFVL